MESNTLFQLVFTFTLFFILFTFLHVKTMQMQTFARNKQKEMEKLFNEITQEAITRSQRLL